MDTTRRDGRRALYELRSMTHINYADDRESDRLVGRVLASMLTPEEARTLLAVHAAPRRSVRKLVKKLRRIAGDS